MTPDSKRLSRIDACITFLWTVQEGLKDEPLATASLIHLKHARTSLENLLTHIEEGTTQ